MHYFDIMSDMLGCPIFAFFFFVGNFDSDILLKEFNNKITLAQQIYFLLFVMYMNQT